MANIERIQLRRDTAANWTSANPILASGEPGFETDTAKLKFGNGTSTWSSLSYYSTGAGGGGGAVDSVNGFTGTVVLNQDNVGDGTTYKQYSAADKTKLAGITAGATVNSADASLLARANHTGTQTASTVSDFSTAADARIAADTTIVRMTGAQTVAGVKTFSSSPVVPTPSALDSSTKVASTAYVDSAVAAGGGGGGGGVWGGITGTLSNQTDLNAALNAKAALASPALTGNPTAPTASAADNDTSIATTAFVQQELTSQAVKLTGTQTVGGVKTFSLSPVVPDATTATQAVSKQQMDAADTLKAPLVSPAFSGTPSLPTGATGITQSPADNSTKLATTAYVDAADTRTAPLASPSLTGTPLAPTAAGGTSTTQIATTAFVATYFALKASPAFTGTPTAPTASPGNNSTQVATTAYADAIAALKANLASPALTGTPTAPTASGGTNTTQIATTAFVAAGFAALASPAFTGTPTVPTATGGTNTTQAASTAFVQSALSSITFTAPMVVRRWNGTAYPVRGTLATGAVVQWIGPEPPTIGGSYAVAGTDLYLVTS